VGADKVGVRLTPYGQFLDAYDSDPRALMTHVVREVGKRGVAYVHMIESRIKVRMMLCCNLSTFVDFSIGVLSAVAAQRLANASL
jgi:hypothetical protein